MTICWIDEPKQNSDLNDEIHLNLTLFQLDAENALNDLWNQLAIVALRFGFHSVEEPVSRPMGFIGFISFHMFHKKFYVCAAAIASHAFSELLFWFQLFRRHTKQVELGSL